LILLGKGQFVDRQAKLIYRGAWQNDQMNGEGSLASLGSNDYLYDGQFCNNLKEGYGKLIKGKEKYVGHFKK